MRIAAICVAACLLAGCFQMDDTVVPTEANIARLEAKLSRLPCIGNLSEWERNYRFSRRTGLFTAYSLSPDLDVIEFHLRRAGTVTIRPGRNVMPPGKSGDWRDSAAIQAIEGRYKIEGGMLDIANCDEAARERST